MIRHVAIVGAGFSGALQAINLLRHAGPRATLIERGPEVARGVAYSAAHPSHLLNVRSGNMSALPDDPGHFNRWLVARGIGADRFVPRITYGAYLGELIAEAAAAAPGRIEIVHDDAVALDMTAAGVRVALAGGRAIDADVGVLALGNLPPHPPQGLDPDAIDPDHYAADPWTPGVAGGLTEDDTLLLIGTGLTMVDVALLVDAGGFRGKVVAMSRRGLAPRSHAEGPPVPAGLSARPSIGAAALLREVRGRAGAVGWRAAVDELRPYTQNMWLAAEPAERARFLRHLRPWWDVHRHRLAPAVAAKIAEMRAAGRLEIVGGRTRGFADGAGGVTVCWRRRGGVRDETLFARRIVNCSGPRVDLRLTDEPLLERLLGAGLIRNDANRLGLDVDLQARVIGADGAANDRLFALGPMTRGAFWEIVAVPDIRVQTWSLARRLSNAHWVGGEGL